MQGYCKFSMIILVLIMLFVYDPLQGRQDHETGFYKGLTIVLLVDVSSSLTNIQVKKYIIEQFVSLAFDSLRREEIDDIFLISFADEATIHNVNTKDAILTELKREMSKSKVETFPKHGLNEVFNLVEERFPSKAGVVLLISDGEDSRHRAKDALSDLKRTIRSLKNNGFTVYSIYLPSSEQFSRKESMYRISNWSQTKLFEIQNPDSLVQIISSLKKEILNAEYCSPVTRSEFYKFQESWNKKFDYLFYSLIILSFIVFALFIILRRKKSIQKTQSLNMLRGKLTYINEKSEKITLDMSEKQIGEKIIIPLNNFPKISFKPWFRNNKKVIEIETEEGIIDVLDEDRKTVNRYIDFHTRFISLQSLLDKKEEFEYEYHFLDLLEQSYKNPAILVDHFDESHYNNFIGREEIINKLRTYYIDKYNESDMRSYLIYGMGKAGKTSLIRHLYYVEFNRNRELREKYSTALIEFKSFLLENENTKKEFSEFEEYIDYKTRKFKQEKNKKKMIFIDDYDMAIDKYHQKFLDLLQNYFLNEKKYFILSGQKSSSLLNPKYSNIGSICEHMNINGLDLIRNFGDEKSNDFKSSIQLINFELSNIGFDHNYLSEEVKKKIAHYSSSIPYFIKRILYTLLYDWLENYDRNPIDINHVEQAANKNIEPTLEVTLFRACDLDKGMYIDQPIPSVSDIINAMAIKGKGVIKKEDTIKEVIPNYSPDRRDSRVQNFENKLKILTSFGFVRQVGDFLIGIPNLFFYRGERVIEHR